MRVTKKGEIGRRVVAPVNPDDSALKRPGLRIMPTHYMQRLSETGDYYAKAQGTYRYWILAKGVAKWAVYLIDGQLYQRLTQADAGFLTRGSILQRTRVVDGRKMLVEYLAPYVGPDPDTLPTDEG